MSETPDPSPADCSHSLPRLHGAIKTECEDFFVEELPAYPPSGAGEHLFLWIEKRDWTTEAVRQHLARTLQIDPREVGTAGLKDRRAVTRQFFSVPAHCEQAVPAAECEGVQILQAQRHTNKLKTGHLRGNRFSILVRSQTADPLERVERIWQHLQREGLPNFYGTQRFGANDSTWQLGLELITGRRGPGSLKRAQRRRLLRLALSSVQSRIFNDVLQARQADGLLQRVIGGDVARPVESRRDFVIEDVDEAQRRVDGGEWQLTGPMFGRRMRFPTGTARKREFAALEAAGLTLDDFNRFPRLTPGTRRPLTVRIADFQATETADGVQFEFALPSGAYATTVLDEFVIPPPGR